MLASCLACGDWLFYFFPPLFLLKLRITHSHTHTHTHTHTMTRKRKLGGRTVCSNLQWAEEQLEKSAYEMQAVMLTLLEPDHPSLFVNGAREAARIIRMARRFVVKEDQRGAPQLIKKKWLNKLPVLPSDATPGRKLEYEQKLRKWNANKERRIPFEANEVCPPTPSVFLCDFCPCPLCILCPLSSSAPCVFPPFFFSCFVSSNVFHSPKRAFIATSAKRCAASL